MKDTCILIALMEPKFLIVIQQLQVLPSSIIVILNTLSISPRPEFMQFVPIPFFFLKKILIYTPPHSSSFKQQY